MAAGRWRRVRAARAPRLALIVGLALGAWQGTPVAAASPLQFSVDVGGCFVAYGPPGALVGVTWTSSAGAIKGRFTATSDAGGFVKTPSVLCSKKAVASGDQLRAVAGDLRRTFTVPRLSLWFDRRTNIVSGVAPASTVLRVNVTRSVELFGSPGGAYCWLETLARNDGTYAVKAQAFANPQCPHGYVARGGDYLGVSWTSARGDAIRIGMEGPHVSLAVGASTIEGSTAPRSDVMIKVRSASGALLGTATARSGPGGAFVATIRDAGGAALSLESGQQVVGGWAGFSTRLTVPDMHFDMIKPYGWIWGYCMPDAVYQLRLDTASSGRSTTGARTDSAGKTALLEYGQALPTGGTMLLRCRYEGGDLITRSNAVP